MRSKAVLSKSMLPSSELPGNEKGRLYHIDCGPGDLAPYILTCGDPVRAGKIARFFDQTKVRRKHREFVTYTGLYKGVSLSVMATGIGPDNTAITVIEASQCISPVTFIRLGSCGALQDYISVGDLVITESALRDENTSHYYALPGRYRASPFGTPKRLNGCAKRASLILRWRCPFT
jgi:uridine phosphorylase